MYSSRILKNVRKHRILHSVTFELTYACNLDCFYCYNNREKTGTLLSLKEYEAVLHDLAKMQTLHLMFTGGEPMVHPHFFDIGRIARDLGFVTRIRTNGHNLGKRVCQKLKQEVDPFVVDVTLHGADADTHDRQTRVPGSFNRLVKNIQTSTEAGLSIGVISTPTAWNEHQIEAMFKLCDTLAVPLKFQGPVASRQNGDRTPLSIAPAKETWHLIATLLAARKEADGDIASNDDFLKDCSGLHEAEESATCSVGVSGVVIDPYGNVQACNHLQDSAGNLHRQSIAEIWNNSPLFQQARMRSIEAAKRLKGQPIESGLPRICVGVEENYLKGGIEGVSSHGVCQKITDLLAED